ncbi:hypothetical protein A1OE_557 [Candidatus Endolissoclinum faulkneri L2]|uniref:Uncharacterized protein n=1 Tax=Candidatus Endolissoclinum faulkneri L2 TaxID=1193729 RepID=K7Z410_9PROT|nr:hypothetical protein A1OE_557 [Candidatus Endolissoclinum faulkneri L2]
MALLAMLFLTMSAIFIIFSTLRAIAAKRLLCAIYFIG